MVPKPHTVMCSAVCVLGDMDVDKLPFPTSTRVEKKHRLGTPTQPRPPLSPFPALQPEPFVSGALLPVRYSTFLRESLLSL